METLEHRQLGDQIRIETLENPYLSGSNELSPATKNTLYVQMMQEIDGIPVPLTNLRLSAGEIVAMAGDYFTKAGWGLKLETAEQTLDSEEASKELFNIKVTPPESEAFHQAYGDLASHHTHYSTIRRIFSYEENPLIPSLVKELIYTLTVRQYGPKLDNNEAHFAPWSLRAYLTAHYNVLRATATARGFYEMADPENYPSKVKAAIPETLKAIIDKIKKDPKKYHFPVKRLDGKLVINLSDQELYTELGHRYHALAVAQDLFAMHFYSDHFAAGHKSRMGRLRQYLPQRFGFLGGILVNNMHNEDNSFGVNSTNIFRKLATSPHPSGKFDMYKVKCTGYGDGTYLKRGNDEEADMLINGMDNSLGDITRLIKTGDTPLPATEYGGIPFLNDVDYSRELSQPLFILKKIDEKYCIYSRKNLREQVMLPPTEYQNTISDPLQHGYQELTFFSALLMVIKLRLLAPFYKSKRVSNAEPQVDDIATTEEEAEQTLLQEESEPQVDDIATKEEETEQTLLLQEEPETPTTGPISNAAALAKLGVHKVRVEAEGETIADDKHLINALTNNIHL